MKPNRRIVKAAKSRKLEDKRACFLIHDAARRYAKRYKGSFKRALRSRGIYERKMRSWLREQGTPARYSDWFGILRQHKVKMEWQNKMRMQEQNPSTQTSAHSSMEAEVA